MAIQTCVEFAWPSAPASVASYTTLTASVCDATNEGAGLIFQAPKAGTLDRFEFLVSGYSSTQTFRCGFSTALSDTTLPTRPDATPPTWVAYRDVSVSANGWVIPGAFTDTGADGGTKLTVTQGQALYLGAHVTGTAGGSSIAALDYGTSSGALFTRPIPYGLAYTGSWAAAMDRPCVALYYDGETNATPLGPEVLPIKAFSTAVNSTGAGDKDQVGFVCTPPMTCRAKGFALLVDLDVGVEARMYGTDGTTVVARATTAGTVWENERRPANAAYWMSWLFQSSVTMTAGSTYRFAIMNATSTDNTVYTFQADDAGALAGHCLGDMYLTTADLATPTVIGDWTDTTTECPFAYVIIDGLDDGAGGGGGLAANPVRGYIG